MYAKQKLRIHRARWNLSDIYRALADESMDNVRRDSEDYAEAMRNVIRAVDLLGKVPREA